MNLCPEGLKSWYSSFNISVQGDLLQVTLLASVSLSECLVIRSVASLSFASFNRAGGIVFSRLLPCMADLALDKSIFRKSG